MTKSRMLRLSAVLAIVAATVMPMPGVANAQVELPADCQVPPFIDLTGVNIVIGTNNSEVLMGTDGRDFICGLLGDDVINAKGGNDLILSDTTTFFGNFGAAGGDDVVNAGAGDDEILPGPGDDTVNGGDGDDFLALALGDDIGNGGPGSDSIIGGLGRDMATGGPGDDFIAGGPGDDMLNGGAGDDFLAGEVPPPPPGTEPTPLPGGPALNDRCAGAGGFDVAVDCDLTSGVEEG